jgi:membrane fusion protein (multidrug efflux system)
MNDVANPKILQSNKASLRPFLVLFALVVVGLGGLGTYSMLRAGRENTDDALVEADIVPIAPRVGGAIQRVLVVDNRQVKRDQLLFVLDDTDLQVRVAQAEAELATAVAQAKTAQAEELIVTASARGGLHSAKAQVSSSEVDVHGADSRVAVARAELEHKKADARKAEIDLRRANELRASGALAAQQLDSVEASAESARAALTQAEAGLLAAEETKRAAVSHVAEAEGKLTASTPIEAQIESAHAQTELAHAREKAAQAALELARLQLSYTHVSAPEDGIVSKLSAHAGQLVSANQPLAQLIPSATYVVANFKETQIGRMRAGNPVEIELDAYPGKKFEGVIESLAGGTGARFSLLPADNASGNFVKVVQRVPVRIAWKERPEEPLAAGLSADVTVSVDQPNK